MSEIKEKNLIQKIAKKHSLELLLLFGSRASEQNYKGSDFDIVYLSKRNLNLEEESKLIIELFPVFKSENVDLVNLKNTPPLLFYAIFNNCAIIYEKNPLIFYYLRAYAFKKLRQKVETL